MNQKDKTPEITRDSSDIYGRLSHDLRAVRLWERIDERKALESVQQRVLRRKFRRRLWSAFGILTPAAAVLALVLLLPNQREFDLEAERKVCIAVPEAAIRVIDADGREYLLDDTHPQVAVAGNHTIVKTGGMLSVRANEQQIGRDLSEVRRITIIIPRGGEYQLSMEDGSKVWLSAESSLVFPERFTGSTREVEMSGEASFEIAKDISKPFIVHVNDVSLRVLGTSFNVYAYPEDKTIVTTLIEGSVMQSIARSGQQLTLRPSQQTRYFKSDGHLTVHNVDAEDFKAYRQGRIVFRNVPLEEIMLSLARTFDYQIDIEREALRHEYYNLIVNKEQSIEEPLDKLITTGAFTYEKKGKQIRIY